MVISKTLNESQRFKVFHFGFMSKTEEMVLYLTLFAGRQLGVWSLVEFKTLSWVTFLKALCGIFIGILFFKVLQILQNNFCCFRRHKIISKSHIVTKWWLFLQKFCRIGVENRPLFDLPLLSGSDSPKLIHVLCPNVHLELIRNITLIKNMNNYWYDGSRELIFRVVEEMRNLPSTGHPKEHLLVSQIRNQVSLIFEVQPLRDQGLKRTIDRNQRWIRGDPPPNFVYFWYSNFRKIRKCVLLILAWKSHYI